MKKETNQTKKGMSKKLIIIAAAVLIAAFAGAVWYITGSTNRLLIDKSQIQTPVITVSPSIPGKVQEIDVKEGQMVSAGDTLAIVGSETLRAQTDGLITSAPDLTGSTVNQATQLIQMIRPINMRVSGTIDEDKGLNRIKVGQVVSFTVDALPGRTFWGYIDEISPSANTPVFAFSSSTERPTQQFTVYAKFNTAAYPDIKNGMSAKMMVYTATR